MSFCRCIPSPEFCPIYDRWWCTTGIPSKFVVYTEILTNLWCTTGISNKFVVYHSDGARSGRKHTSLDPIHRWTPAGKKHTLLTPSPGGPSRQKNIHLWTRPWMEPIRTRKSETKLPYKITSFSRWLVVVDWLLIGCWLVGWLVGWLSKSYEEARCGGQHYLPTNIVSKQKKYYSLLFLRPDSSFLAEAKA